MEIVKSYLTRNPCYKANVNKADSRYTTFQSKGPRGLMLHSVGCAQPDASVFIRLWNKESYSNACVHGFIDANSGIVFQTLPWNYRGWHCAGSGNNTHVGVEMCESGAIEYIKGTANSFRMLDKARAQADCRRAYNAAVELFAMLCKRHRLDPLTQIVSHKEGCKLGIASNHGDPEHYWRGCGLPYTMDGFRADVKSKMTDEVDNMTKQELELMIDQRATAIAESRAKQIAEGLLREMLGPYIYTIKDVPHVSVQREVRRLLDKEIINGGTPFESEPDDINLPYAVLRGVVMSARYTDASLKPPDGGEG